MFTLSRTPKAAGRQRGGLTRRILHPNIFVELVVAGSSGTGVSPWSTIHLHHRQRRSFYRPPQEVECADNREVIATAMEMKDGLDMEIWDHKRFVIRLTLSPFRGTRPPSK